MKNPSPHVSEPSGIMRCLAAIFYDSLLLFSVLFLAGLVALPFSGGEAASPLYSLYLLGVSYFYFAWQWTHGGQTLGMRTWQIRLQHKDGGRVTWPQTLRRFSAAMLSWLACGGGFFWILANKENRSWHDILSNTRLVKKS
ncbi:MAG: RDD family protein [Gammaproteobacteria bacterium]|nr:RDD family protein [Gammaproteobacteria bacterium]